VGVAYLLIGLAPVVFAMRGARETHVLSPASITHVDGASYIASIPPTAFAPILVAASDGPGHEQRSASRLFEDRRELGPAHAVHVGIAAVGRGRFSHWTTTVYLSASDNSDPRTNSHVYRLETVARLPMMVTVAWVLTVMLAAAMSTWFWMPGGSARPWFLNLLPTILAVASVAAVAVMSLAGIGPTRMFALASWLVLGFVAAFCAGVSMRRVPTAGFVRGLAEVTSAVMETLKSGSSTAPLRFGSACLLIGLAPLVFANRGVIETYVISPADLTPVDGASYVASVPPSPFAPVLVAASDAPGHEQRSASRLFEGRRELGPAHALHVDVAAKGDGRFSHWATAVYISASDSSDPRTNGRFYTLETAARLPMMITVACVLTFILAAAMSSWFWVPGGPARAWWRPRLWPPALAAASLVAVAVMSTAGPGFVRVWALVSWLVAGFVASFFAGIAMRRVSSAGLATAASEEVPALVATWKSAGSIATSLEQRTFEAPGWRGLAARTACLALAAGVFVVMLTIHWPEWVLSQAYRGGGRVILVAALALWVAHARRGWLAVCLGLTVTLALFALPLASLWQDVTTNGFAIGGLPWSDAQGYYVEANRLIDGHPLEWSSRRPFFTAFLAVLLAVTHSLYVTLAIMVALNAIGTFLLARELRMSFGAAGATVATVILFAFYRHDGGAGVALTENLGFLIGTMGCTALLRGVRLQDIRSYGFGAVALTAALMARAGAFFVLPALIAVAPISLRPADSRRLNMRSAVVTICAIVIALATFLTWGRAVSNRAAENSAFSNYSYVLYGLVVGGKGWQQVSIDHPNAREGAEIYRLAYEEFRARPSGLIEGMARMVRAYLWPSEPYHMFAFIQDDPRTRLLQRMCYVLAALGLGACVWRWREPTYALVLAVAAGHLASIPLVPTIDAGLRVYAATMPVVAAVVAAGVAVFGGLFSRPWRYLAKGTAAKSQAVPDVTTRLSEWAALTLLAVIMGTSLTLCAVGKPPTTLTRHVCPSGSESLVVRVDDDAVLRIDDDRVPRQISPTAIRQSEVQWAVGNMELKAEAYSLRAGMSVVITYDPTNGRQAWLAGETSRLQTRSGLLQICGHYSQDPTARYYGFIFIDEAWPLEVGRSH
jgi:hypothetical protein